MSFDVLISKIKEKNNPTVMGLDPKLEYVPEFIREGRSISEALFEFNKRLIDCTVDLVPAVKPQSAFYEMYGMEGMIALANTVKYAKSQGLYVILDVKRGDIGSTAQAYAEAFFGEASNGEDCVTVNPYLGSDGVLPFVSAAEKYDKTIFALVKTSNPSSSELQDLDVGGKTLYRKVGELVEEWGSGNIGENGYSRVGAVVGATHPDQLTELRAALPHTFFLIPGYGAQGGTAKDAARAFDANGNGAIVNSSRGLMCAYMKKNDPQGFEKHTRDAVLEMKNALNAEISVK